MENNNVGMKKEGFGANVLVVGHRCWRCSHEWLSYDKNNIPKVCPKCKSPYWDRERLTPKKENKKTKSKGNKK